MWINITYLQSLVPPWGTLEWFFASCRSSQRFMTRAQRKPQAQDPLVREIKSLQRQSIHSKYQLLTWHGAGNHWLLALSSCLFELFDGESIAYHSHSTTKWWQGKKALLLGVTKFKALRPTCGFRSRLGFFLQLVWIATVAHYTSSHWKKNLEISIELMIQLAVKTRVVSIGCSWSAFRYWLDVSVSFDCFQTAVHLAKTALAKTTLSPTHGLLESRAWPSLVEAIWWDCWTLGHKGRLSAQLHLRVPALADQNSHRIPACAGPLCLALNHHQPAVQHLPPSRAPPACRRAIPPRKNQSEKIESWEEKSLIPLIFFRTVIRLFPCFPIVSLKYGSFRLYRQKNPKLWEFRTLHWPCTLVASVQQWLSCSNHNFCRYKWHQKNKHQ